MPQELLLDVVGEQSRATLKAITRHPASGVEPRELTEIVAIVLHQHEAMKSLWNRWLAGPMTHGVDARIGEVGLALASAAFENWLALADCVRALAESVASRTGSKVNLDPLEAARAKFVLALEDANQALKMVAMRPPDVEQGVLEEATSLYQEGKYRRITNRGSDSGGV